MGFCDGISGHMFTRSCCCTTPLPDCDDIRDVGCVAALEAATPNFDDDADFLLPRACRPDEAPDSRIRVLYSHGEMSGSLSPPLEDFHEDMFATPVNLVTEVTKWRKPSMPSQSPVIHSTAPQRSRSSPNLLATASLGPSPALLATASTSPSPRLLAIASHDGSRRDAGDVLQENPGERDPLMMLEQGRCRRHRLKASAGHPGVRIHRTFASTEIVMSKSTSSTSLASATAPKGHMVEHARVAALKENRAARRQRAKDVQATYNSMRDGMMQWCSRSPDTQGGSPGHVSRNDIALQRALPVAAHMQQDANIISI